MMQTDVIRVRGCRVHNLKNIDLDIPRGQLVVFCGLSGSGKTSFALDTLYAEGQRRYIESFSAYTRQFLQRLDKPDCDLIQGIPPAIAVTRAGAWRTSRSTVGTATEIADHLRLLFAKIATLRCHVCGREVKSYDPGSIATELQTLPRSARLMVGFEVHLPDRQQASEILLGLQQEGYQRLIVGDRQFHLSDSDRGELAKAVGKTGVDAIVVVDRLTGESDLARVTESLETAMSEGYGKAIVLLDPASVGDEAAAVDADWVSTSPRVPLDSRDWIQAAFSQQRRCDRCGIDYPEPSQRLFNFNQPLGACSLCEGFGDIVEVDMDLVVPDPELTLRQGAIAPWRTPAYSHELDELLALASDYDVPVDVPFKSLKKKHLKLIQEGVPQRKFGGLNGFFAWLDRKKYKMHIRVFLSRYRSYRRCPQCNGQRLKPEALAYRIGGKNMAELSALRGEEAAWFFTELHLDAHQQIIAQEPLEQISHRLRYLSEVGLSYLQIDRTLRTLSGGETQRVTLTGALGSALVNMLYVLDEPTAGLHPHDVDRLRDAILGAPRSRQYRGRGRT